MPPATQLRSRLVDYKAIVAKVLKCRPEISAKRRDVITIASIIRAEFQRERDKLGAFRSALKANIADGNAKQRQKMQAIKQKYDKEGIEVVEDEA